MEKKPRPNSDTVPITYPGYYRALTWVNRKYHYRCDYRIVRIYDLICKVLVWLCPFPKMRHTPLVRLLYLVRYRIPVNEIGIIFSMLSLHRHFTKHAERVETLILGSSHGVYGFIPQDNSECNLSFSSCDLYYTAQLFKAVLNKAPHLKRALIFFSPFSSGFRIQNSSWAITLSGLMQTVWGIPRNPDGRVSTEELKHSAEIRRFIQDKHDSLYLETRELLDLRYDLCIKTTATNYIRNLSDGEAQYYRKLPQTAALTSELKHLYSLIECARESGILTYVIVPPYTRFYLSHFDEQPVFKHLKPLLKDFYPQVTVLDYTADRDFCDLDFYDPHHLNRGGAYKLTHKIRQAIRLHEDL